MVMTPEDLRRIHPSATADECDRFARNCSSSSDSDASAHLGVYLEWKSTVDAALEEFADEPSLWMQCMKAAIAKDKFSLDDDDVSSSPLVLDPILVAPCNSRNEPFRCVEGKPILYVYPARMDFNNFPAEIYTSCMLLFCYKIFKGEPFTVMVDVRAGQGWPNVSITKMYPWLRACCSKMSQFFPGGLHKCIVFTIPFVAKALWLVVQPLIGRSIADSLVLIPGAGTAYSTPLPEGAMSKYVCVEYLQVLEKMRKDAFRELDEVDSVHK